MDCFSWFRGPVWPTRLVNLPCGGVRLRRQAESFVRRTALVDAIDEIAGDGGAVLEPVPGAAAGDPHLGPRGMPVDDEIARARVLVLTDPCINQRRAAQPGKSAGDPVARGLDDR